MSRSRDVTGRARGAHQEGGNEGDAAGDRGGDYVLAARIPPSGWAFDASRPRLDWNSPADVAQLVEHFTRNEGVPGSSPGVGFA